MTDDGGDPDDRVTDTAGCVAGILLALCIATLAYLVWTSVPGR